MNRSQLRRQINSRRQQITPAAARRAGLQATRHAWRLPLLARAKRIAVYFPMGGEIDCRPLVEQAWARSREVYLPVLRQSGLRFRAYTPSTRLAPNRFRIPEPTAGSELPPGALDVAITPLVAFDLRGNRLGMGGGFYDRSFRFLQQRNSWRHPHLVGFAYDMQCVSELDSRAWDVPLDAIVTESSSYVFPS